MANLSRGDATIRVMLAGGLLFLMMEVMIVVPSGPRQWVLGFGIGLAMLLVGTARARFCPVYRIAGIDTAQRPNSSSSQASSSSSSHGS